MNYVSRAAIWSSTASVDSAWLCRRDVPLYWTFEFGWSRQFSNMAASDRFSSIQASRHGIYHVLDDLFTFGKICTCMIIRMGNCAPAYSLANHQQHQKHVGHFDWGISCLLSYSCANIPARSRFLRLPRVVLTCATDGFRSLSQLHQYYGIS